MTARWEERLYSVVVALQPRVLRQEFGEEMKLMLSDMLKDPATPRWRVWVALVDDIGNLMSGGVKIGVIFGSVALFAVFAHGAALASGHYAFPGVALLVVALAFVAAGFVGARRTGFVRGLGAGAVAGAVSLLAFPLDTALSGRTWWDSPLFVGILLVASAEGFALVVLGATVARVGDIQRRIRRGAVAFAEAWMAS